MEMFPLELHLQTPSGIIIEDLYTIKVSRECKTFLGQADDYEYIYPSIKIITMFTVTPQWNSSPFIWHFSEVHYDYNSKDEKRINTIRTELSNKTHKVLDILECALSIPKEDLPLYLDNKELKDIIDWRILSPQPEEREPCHGTQIK